MHITIIGHNGKMGGTFFKRFQEAGHFVNGIDIPYDDTELFKA